MMFRFVHWKSKPKPSAWRMRGSLNASRRVLNHQPWAPEGASSGTVRRHTRPSSTAGKS